MAFNNFHRLPTRNQSSLVTQLHKLINYYGEIFPGRERSYLKNLSLIEKAVYWLEDEEKKMIAAAIIDPNHSIQVDGVDLTVLGYLISKRSGQIDRILAHIWSDYEDKSIVLFSRPSLAAAIDTENLGLVSLSSVEVVQLWPNLANIKTGYFNIQNENLVNAVDRKRYNLFLRITPADLLELSKTAPDLVKLIEQRKAEASE